MPNAAPKKAIKAKVQFKNSHLQLVLNYSGLPINKLVLENEFYHLSVNLKSKANRIVKGTLMIPKRLVNDAFKSKKIIKHGYFSVKRNGDYVDICFTSNPFSIKRAVKDEDNYTINITIRENKKTFTNLNYTIPVEMFNKLSSDYQKAKKIEQKVGKNNKPKTQSTTPKPSPLIDNKNMRICSKCFYYKIPKYCKLLHKQPTRGEANRCHHFNNFKGVEVVFKGGAFSPK